MVTYCLSGWLLVKRHLIKRRSHRSYLSQLKITVIKQVMTTLFSSGSCNEFVQNLVQEAFQALNRAFWTPELHWLHRLLARSLPSDFLNTNSNQRESLYRNSVIADISLIVGHIRKTDKLYLLDLASGNLNSATGSNEWPYLPLQIWCCQDCLWLNIISGMLLESTVQVHCGMKTSQAVCLALQRCQYWLSLPQTQKVNTDMARRLHLQFVTHPLLLNWRDIASVLVPVRWVFNLSKQCWERKVTSNQLIWAPASCSTATGWVWTLEERC